MNKLTAFGIGVITLLLTFVLVIFGIMNTRYLTPSAQWVTEKLWANKFTFTDVKYEYPTHFTLNEVTITTENTPIKFNKIDIWLNRTLVNKEHKIVIDSLLLNSANFAQGLPSIKLPQNLQINQIAIDNIDFSYRGLIARGVNYQVKNPAWKSTDQHLPFGETQLSADQFYWQGEAFDKILIDADYKPENSTIYGISFQWRDGDFSGQAEQYDTGWSLVNTTVKHLNLPLELNNTSQKLWQQAVPYITHINSLDILSSHLNIAGVEFNNLEASFDNLSLNQSLWQQDKGYMSLNADSVLWQELQWIEPNIKIDFSPESISVSDFSSEVLQGSVQMSATIKPETLHINQLNMSGIKWFAEREQDFAWIPKQWPTLKELTVDRLEINNLQLIQLMNKPFWQLSGLSIKGSKTQWKNNALWEGYIAASANSASFGELITTQGVIEMHSKEGQWQLDRAFIPLEKGYLDARASWDLSTPSSPWSITAHVDGLPFSVINHFIKLPLKIDALSEFDINAEGLAGDYSMLSHSLSGELNASLRDGTMVIEKPESMVIQPFEMDNAQFTADRGRIKLEPTPLEGLDLQALLAGQLDLVAAQEGQFELNIQQGCEHIRYDIIKTKQVYKSCTDPK